jgi:hypothetical protein
MRARSAGVSSARGNGNSSNQQHHCLVCSLVARQAKTMLERASTSSSSTKISPKSSSIKRSSSNVISFIHDKTILNSSSTRKSPDQMPPPPPRTTFSLSSLKIADANQQALQQHQAIPYESPPSMAQLQLHAPSALAVAVAPKFMAKDGASPVNPDSLARSFDSAKGSFMSPRYHRRQRSNSQENLETTSCSISSSLPKNADVLRRNRSASEGGTPAVSSKIILPPGASPASLSFETIVEEEAASCSSGEGSVELNFDLAHGHS